MSQYRTDSEKKGRVVPEGRGGLVEGTLVGGRYRTCKLLARGGMSSVYLAVHEKLSRYVALKIFAPAAFEPDEIETFEERFRVEATTLAALDHPNLVTVYDYGETEDGRYYLAMEYVRGPRFSEILKAGPMPPGRVVALVRQVCDALQYAHAQGVVHRDIKLSNIMLREPEGVGDDFVKVVDFGLAKLLEQDQSLTAVGVIMGSPHFMAPEQVRGQEVSPRTDIYAVGVLTFCALTGRYPFHARTPAGTLTAHLTEPVPSMGSLARERYIPEDLEVLVSSCLAKAEGDRFADMGELIAALDNVVMKGGIEDDDTEQTEPTITRLPAPLSLDDGAVATQPSWLDLTTHRTALPVVAIAGVVSALLALALLVQYVIPAETTSETLPAEIVAKETPPEDREARPDVPDLSAAGTSDEGAAMPPTGDAQVNTAQSVPVATPQPAPSTGTATRTPIVPTPTPVQSVPVQSPEPEPEPEPEAGEDVDEQAASDEGWTPPASDLRDPWAK